MTDGRFSGTRREPTFTTSTRSAHPIEIKLFEVPKSMPNPRTCSVTTVHQGCGHQVTGQERVLFIDLCQLIGILRPQIREILLPLFKLPPSRGKDAHVSLLATALGAVDPCAFVYDHTLKPVAAMGEDPLS